MMNFLGFGGTKAPKQTTPQVSPSQESIPTDIYGEVTKLTKIENELKAARTVDEFFDTLSRGGVTALKKLGSGWISVAELHRKIKNGEKNWKTEIGNFEHLRSLKSILENVAEGVDLSKLKLNEAEKQAKQIEEMSAENRVIELEIKPKLLQAKSRLEFFGILESENIRNIPFSGGNSIPTETLNNAIIKYILDLKGKTPSVGEMFFDVVQIGEVQGIGQEFKDVLNRLILKEIAEAGEDRLCRVTFESNRQNLPQAKTLAEFLRLLSEGGLQKIPLTSGDFLEIEKLKESILEYILKQETSPDGSLFFDTFIVGEVSGIGQKFKDILNQLILKNIESLANHENAVESGVLSNLKQVEKPKENEDDEDTSGFDPTQSPDDENDNVEGALPVDQEFPVETPSTPEQPVIGVFDISDTLRDGSEGGKNQHERALDISEVIDDGYVDLREKPVRNDQVDGEITDATIINEKQSRGLGLEDFKTLPPKEPIDPWTAAMVAEAVSDLPSSPQKDSSESLRSTILNALESTDAIPVESSKKLKPEKTPSHRLIGTGLLGTLGNFGKKVEELAKKKEELAKQVSGWGSKFRNGLNRLIAKDPVSKKEPSPEGETFDIHPEEIASILTASPTSPESHKALEALSSVNKSTDSLLQNALETTTGAAKTILEKVELLGEKFNKLPKSVRYGTGIAIAGLGASGAPLVVPALALATVFRVASGAGLYATLHKALENTYAKEEAAGRKVKVLRKQVMGAGAITVSAFAGYAIGQYISGLFPTDVAPHTAGLDVGQIESAASAPAPEVVASAAATTQIEEVTQAASEQMAQEAVAAPAHEMIHIVIEGENLWTIVKDRLMQSDTFAALSEQARNIEISKYLAAIQEAKIFPHGIDNIHAGDTIDFSQFDGKIPEDILKQVNLFTK